MAAAVHAPAFRKHRPARLVGSRSFRYCSPRAVGWRRNRRDSPPVGPREEPSALPLADLIFLVDQPPRRRSPSSTSKAAAFNPEPKRLPPERSDAHSRITRGCFHCLVTKRCVTRPATAFSLVWSMTLRNTGFLGQHAVPAVLCVIGTNHLAHSAKHGAGAVPTSGFY